MAKKKEEEKKKKKPFETDVSRERKKQFDIRKEKEKGKDRDFVVATRQKAQGTTEFGLAEGRPDIQAEFERQDLVEREAFEKRQSQKSQITQLLALAQHVRPEEVSKLQRLANQIITEQAQPQQQIQEQPQEEDKSFLQQVREGIRSVNELGGITPSAVAREQGETLLGGAPVISPAAAPGTFSSLLSRGGTVLSRGGTAATKTTTGRASELSKLSATRKTAIANLLKGTKRTGNVVDDAINRELAAFKIARIARLGKGKAGVDASVRMINSYNAWSKSRVMNFLAKKPVKTTLKIGGAVAGTDVILTWFALDNVSSGMPFLVPTVEESMAQNIMTPEEALETFNEAEVAYDLALRKSNLSAIINPLLWPSSKLITQGAKIKRFEYDLKKANFLAKYGL
jgi:hypothetical protein